ncbi:MAG: MFS transporter [Pelagibacteraceae bacterium]|nr:MFS transporter [Pelagibacteraceae bacterium]OUV89585.1 MAG: MFS transporter [Pelagibacteraceae bacterium TMED146]
MKENKFLTSKATLITLLIGCFVVSVSMGIRQTYGLFFQFFENDLNISNTFFGLAIGVQAIVWGVFATIFGIIADKHGANKVTIVALLVYAFGIYALGNLNSTGFLFQLNLGIFVGIGLGGAAAPIIVPTVAKHFPNHNRAKAAGLVTASASVGMFLYPILSSALFKYYEWQYVFNIFVFIILSAAILSYFLKQPSTNEGSQNNQNSNQTLSEAFKEAFGHKSYLFLMAGFFVCGFQITLVATHVPKYVIERGLDVWTGPAILSLIGLFNIFGTLTMGYLADKYSKKILLSGLYFFRGIIIILFLFLPSSNYLAIGFGICFGFLWLATIPATFGLVAQVFGTRYLSMLSGLIFFSHQLGSFSGAYLGGYFFDNFGSYNYAWYLSIALSFFATLMHLPIDERPLKRVATV